MIAIGNFLAGLILGFLLCAWALDESPIDSLGKLGDRIEDLAASYE